MRMETVEDKALNTDGIKIKYDDITEQSFRNYISDLLRNPLVMQMKRYKQHGNTDCYHHCLRVAYFSYRICSLMGLKAREAARAGMLHDFFLYDWHTHAQETGKRFHGLNHPRIALENAQNAFTLSEAEKDMILKHMWPLTLIPPRYPESFVICFVDKLCSICEIAEKLMHKK